MTTINDNLAERGKRYGEFAGRARLNQALTEIMHAPEGWRRLSAEQRQALEMIQFTIAGILNGDPNYADSWVDIAGYATLCVRVEPAPVLTEAEARTLDEALKAMGAGGERQIPRPPRFSQGITHRTALGNIEKHRAGCQCVACDAATKAWDDQLAREQGADEAVERKSFFNRFPSFR